MLLTSIISNCAISLETSVRKIGLHIITFAFSAGRGVPVHETLQVHSIRTRSWRRQEPQQPNTMFTFERYDDGDSSKF